VQLGLHCGAAAVVLVELRPAARSLSEAPQSFSEDVCIVAGVLVFFMTGAPVLL